MLVTSTTLWWGFKLSWSKSLTNKKNKLSINSGNINKKIDDSNIDHQIYINPDPVKRNDYPKSIASTSSFVKHKDMKPAVLSRYECNADDLMIDTDNTFHYDVRLPSNLPNISNLQQAFQVKSQSRAMFYPAAAVSFVSNPLFSNNELVTSVYVTNQSASHFPISIKNQESKLTLNTFNTLESLEQTLFNVTITGEKLTDRKNNAYTG